MAPKNNGVLTWVQLRTGQGFPRSVSIEGKTYRGGEPRPVTAELAATLLAWKTRVVGVNGSEPVPTFEVVDQSVVPSEAIHKFIDKDGLPRVERVPATTKPGVNNGPVVEVADQLIHPVPFVPRERIEYPLFFRGPLVESYSIAHVMRNLAWAAHRNGIETYCVPQKNTPECPTYWAAIDYIVGVPDKPYVTVAWDPHVFQYDENERARVHIDPCDSFRYRDDNVVATYASSEVAALLCFSEMGRSRWVDAGVPSHKVHVFRLGVDPNVYNPGGRRRGLSDVQWLNRPVGGTDVAPDADTYAYLVAGYLQHRKGLPDVLAAYLAEYTVADNVALVVKNVADQWGKDVKNAVAAAVRGAGPRAPRVGLLQQRMTDWDFAALLRGVDCLVNAHYLEGFGLLPLQAMACGRQVIVTDYHGPTAYATADNAILIPVDREEEATGRLIPSGVQWARYTQEALRGCMRQAYTGKGSSGRRQAAVRTAKQWTWEQSAADVTAVVHTHVAPVQQRPRKWLRRDIDVSVVTPLRGNVAKCAHMLSTLYENADRSFEVLIFDDANNAEDRAAIEHMASQYDGARVISRDVHTGCHGGRQILYEEAVGKYVASIDSDLDFRATRRGWMARMMELCEQRANGGIVHALLVRPPDENGVLRVQSAGGYARTGEDIPCWHRLPTTSIETPEVAQPAEIVYGSGAWQFFANRTLNEVFMDGHYWPAYYGDSDFCFRMRHAGYPVWYCPEVVVVHDDGTWTSTRTGKFEAKWHENRQRFAEHWLDLCVEDRKRVDETGALQRLDATVETKRAIDYAVASIPVFTGVSPDEL